MSRYINKKLRNLVEKRAGENCEYCLISIEDTYFGGEIDHIIGIKHGGATESDNLTFACQPCNRNKGSDLGSISTGTKNLVRFFNPRTDKWSEHFRLNGARIEFLTEIGEVTARILGFNELERLQERQGLIEINRYPSQALKRILV
ncbi:MAG: HNH endonuclease [Acidobacteriota bacterium]|nr:HNH endonuclease [Acidobacteriota bacterium]